MNAPKSDVATFDPDAVAMAEALEEMARACREGRMRLIAVQSSYVPVDEDDSGGMFHYEEYVRTYSGVHELLGLMLHHQQSLTHRVFYAPDDDE